eukprot:TRINITY_DN100969_c0_g1_i1.p1 TRINITY_DN100969_c0_g1~~TRINITY_DN100969_c0_g1_i1.p1  ORF type:complete len:356 (-),score=70.76 TRINITY_DN100969_c0_g1_i1:313-1380(-)
MDHVHHAIAKVEELLPDIDDVFAYDTVKLVKVLDRRLGLVFYGVQFAVIVYIVVFVFIIKQQYLQDEKTTGWLMCRVLEAQYDENLVAWDIYDRVTNPGEQGAVFIPTRVLITRGQVQDGFCESPVHNCTTPADCDIGDEAVQKKQCTNGMCIRRQWCPAENPALPTTETHLLDIEDVQLWFQTYAHFNLFNLDVYTTDEDKPVHYPRRRANTYRLADVMRMSNLDPEQFQENGAVMLVNALFKCNLDAGSCDMKIESANVDTKTGYNHVVSQVYWEDGVRKRDTYRMYGIRIMAFTTGLGSKTSFSQILLQVSSAIALLGVAEIVADVWLMMVVPERKHYIEQKIIQTEDFGSD